MSGVDVLAWFGPCEGNTPNDRAAREVRDAVAELIHAVKKVNATKHGDGILVSLGDFADLAVAYARVTGGASEPARYMQAEYQGANDGR